MILLDDGVREASSFRARVLLAHQLKAAGFDVGIDQASLPGELNRVDRYEVSPFIVTATSVRIDGIIVLAAHEVSDDLLWSIRNYRLEKDAPIVAIGRFTDLGQRISAVARLSYALDREPEVVDLSEIQPDPLLPSATMPLFGGPLLDMPQATKQTFLLHLPKELPKEGDLRHCLTQLGRFRGLELAIMCPSKLKGRVADIAPQGVRIWSHNEILPSALAATSKLALVTGEASPGFRMGFMSAQLIAHGGLVIDATSSGAIHESGAPVVRGPLDILQIPLFLEREVLPRLNAIELEIEKSPWRRDNDVQRLLDTLQEKMDLSHRRLTVAPTPKTVFLPTNGVGLGHAQRCSLIASEMECGPKPIFAAFPSCLGLVESRGFSCRPLISKSVEQTESYSNDIMNYRRLLRWISAGDRFVFDGVYIFDSIYRTILEKRLDAVWIRRGLWKDRQDNSTALAREHAFNRVIVPGEAFDELNETYSLGDKVRHVGPIVRCPTSITVSRKVLRERIARSIGRNFDKLVVSMLGGGVASDRGPQLQTICASLEGRPDVVHLVVFWPNTKVAPGLALWKNTVLVRSNDALPLAIAADFLISATGYNTFHEVLYHKIPCIMIPQVAMFIDDQERRARAASGRGLIELVMPDDFSGLERSVGLLLEDSNADALRDRLEAQRLPEPGNKSAARIIQEAKAHED